MQESFKILRRTSQNSCFWYKNSNAYRNYSGGTGQLGHVSSEALLKVLKARGLEGLSVDAQVTNAKNYDLWFLDEIVVQKQ